jgi:hypothetical protein
VAGQDTASVLEAIQQKDPVDRVKQIYDFVFVVAFAVFSVLLTTRMDGYTSYNYTAVFAPWIAYEIFAILLCLYCWLIQEIPVPVTPDRETEDTAETQDMEQRFTEMITQRIVYTIYHGRSIMKWQYGWEAVDHVLRIVLALLVAMKIDGDVDSNWRTVFVPVYLSMTLWMLIGYYQYTFLTKTTLSEITEMDLLTFAKVQSFFGGGGDLFGTPSFGEIAVAERVSLAMVELEVARGVGQNNMFAALVCLIVVPMLVTRLDGLNNINAFKIITPWFMLCGALVLACCCTTTLCLCTICLPGFSEFSDAAEEASSGPTRSAEAHFSDVGAYEAPTVVTAAAVTVDGKLEEGLLATTANVVNADVPTDATRSAQFVTAIDEGID